MDCFRLPVVVTGGPDHMIGITVYLVITTTTSDATGNASLLFVANGYELKFFQLTGNGLCNRIRFDFVVLIV